MPGGGSHSVIPEGPTVRPPWFMEDLGLLGALCEDEHSSGTGGGFMVFITHA